ncbi:MAG: L-threonylcarbamoyladenylate synthase [Eubacteriaceae bacterium]
MKTKIAEIERLDGQGLKNLMEMAELLKKGGTVVFPTETVYGLGADALNVEAIKKIYIAKGRPKDNPLIVHLSQGKDVESLVKEINGNAKKLMDKFWPGPLTIIMEKSSKISKEVTGGLETVALRVPNHPIAQNFIKIAGCPVAAPSANLSGKPSPTQGKHVLEDLDGRVDGIITSKASEVGLESTVVDTTVNPPMILRPGAITYEDLKEVLGEIQISTDVSKVGEKTLVETIKSPGMKYKHYAPKGEMVVVKGKTEDIVKKINENAKKAKASGNSIGILATDETMEHYREGFILSLGSIHAPHEMGRNLFSRLRTFDDLGVQKIFAEDISLNNDTLALVNRLYKAAGYQFI